MMVPIITHDDGWFYRWLVFSARYLKTDAVKIAKLDVQLFHNESWKRIYFGVKRSEVRDTSKNSAGVVFALL